ncbi:MAG: hypothetical protein R2695_00530 [Acidimicrobiales bacterium]
MNTESETDKASLDGVLTVGPLSDEAVWADPEFRTNCVDPVIEAHPEMAEELNAPLPTADEQAAGTASWLLPIRSACNQTMLLRALGEIAGADLTNDSFLEALDELGTVELYGLGQASFTSAGKWDGLDEFSLQVYDAATGTLQPEGDPIIVDR